MLKEEADKYRCATILANIVVHYYSGGSRISPMGVREGNYKGGRQLIIW